MTDEQPVRRYRFRVRTADGRELMSGVSAMKLPAPLSGAQWGRADLAGGEPAPMSVAAPGREGETLRFSIEHFDGAWKQVSHASVQVAQGKAQAQPPLPPVSGKVRFRAASADGAEVVSAEASVRASPAQSQALLDAHFGHAQYVEGAQAELSVKARGLDGEALVARVERKDGEQWKPLEELRGAVEKGEAHLSWKAVPGTVRFTAAAGFASATSEAIEVSAAALKNPGWTRATRGAGAHFNHGEQAGMRVEAPGLEGRTVQFTLEQLRDGQWQPHSTVTASVKDGVAIGQASVAHPDAAQPGRKPPSRLGDAPPAPLRFHATLVEE